MNSECFQKGTHQPDFAKSNWPGRDGVASQPRYGSNDMASNGVSQGELRAAGAAHDLSNLLQVAASAIRLIERGVDPSTSSALRPFFAGAFTSLEQACRLSRTIFSRIPPEAAVAQLTSIEECLNAIAEVIVLAAGPEIDVAFRLTEPVPMVLCDPGLLQDAVLNLVINANHAMPSGGGLSVEVSSEQAHGSPAQIAIVRIGDTGCGMSEELLSRVFDAFVTTRTDGIGSGLGLAMVSEFVRSAGGRVDVQSRPGCGTVFTIRLPGTSPEACSGGAPSRRNHP